MMQTRTGYNVEIARQEIVKMLNNKQIKVIHKFTNEQAIVETTNGDYISWIF